MELMTIAAPDGPSEAYVARPENGHGPGVLLFMDAIGLRPQIADMADRIASWGYVVLAPNTLYRSGTAAETSPTRDLREPGARDEFFQQAMPRVDELTADRTTADIAAYTDALAHLDGVTGGRFGTVGYCMGAQLAVRAAGQDQRFVAVGGFHGARLATDEPDSPHLGLPNARAELVFGHADQDRSMPPEAIERLGDAMEAAGLTATNEVYSGAAHGYTMADTAVYDEAATERMYTELRALLDRTLSPA
ncbi:dienelactone hydrolase family protein [Luteipulveratus sp. YIM 133132]|uniref:dienelactone hydrolase family protein n=1 Tax=Luteipulveratus flavus TaxID=3031728 RepID=UPI0023B05A72|nr:dienelactone hydrolase family protein [Luteipulveratus sp. YIM 133132]MDE9366326.1 dienelactone hydrolase family protein [Luteipulveratus sp. YIM 133132]